MTDTVEALRKAATFLQRVKRQIEALPDPARKIALEGLAALLKEHGHG